MPFKKFYKNKAPFYAIKTRSSKSQKIVIFAKGLTRGMGQKWPFFNLFLLGSIGQENVFYNILEQ